MPTIDSHISAASQIATRLIKRNAEVTMATKKRDVCLYNFFEAILDLDKPLRNMGKPEDARKALKARYGTNLPASNNPAMLAIKLTYPTLAPHACSKYAAALRFVQRKKKPDQSVREFMRAHGGINGCVTEEKKSRPPKGNLGKPGKK
jgi:hypothetical protein